MISTRLNSEALCKSYSSFDECVICQDVCLKENSGKYMENVLTIDTPQTGEFQCCCLTQARNELDLSIHA